MTPADPGTHARPGSPAPDPPAMWYSRAAMIASPRRRADVLVEMLGHEALLADARSGGIHRLNETALEIWRSCDGSTTTREIARRLSSRYDVDPEEALDHVEETIAMFAHLGCVE